MIFPPPPGSPNRESQNQSGTVEEDFYYSTSTTTWEGVSDLNFWEGYIHWVIYTKGSGELADSIDSGEPCGYFMIVVYQPTKQATSLTMLYGFYWLTRSLPASILVVSNNNNINNTTTTNNKKSSSST